MTEIYDFNIFFLYLFDYVLFGKALHFHSEVSPIQAGRGSIILCFSYFKSLIMRQEGVDFSLCQFLENPAAFAVKL